MNLNELALRRCERLVQQATELNIAVLRDETGARIVDCGVHVPGGIEAGIALAEVCLAGLGRVDVVPCDRDLWTGSAVTIRTDQPVAACMASQYAGWQVAGEKFFAMGSGPMRAVRGREELFAHIGYKESADAVVGVLEAGKLPHEDVCHHLAAECRVEAEKLTLLVAPTASLAGTIQVVARSVETALHKLHEVGFELSLVRSGFGAAPLPPVAGDHLAGIGRTNDAVLYGGEVTLWVDGDDDALREFGPQIPSSSSPDHGHPFAEIFARYDRDFYKIDPMLFSPAVVTLNNVETGTSLRFGETVPQVIHQSFAS
ncbi:MAG: methenyltetrahydromethanopterin cyclohydrolase [Planctomycetaceae bacterium]|jgi:methenyltetrahydromethanopterin cyclohydrolase|nr:methenyltetrahydromethanopterin cyclohydrolase [Planctomycetaceae bacterium]